MKVIFVVKYVSAMVFGGIILGGTCKIWDNPYWLYCLIIKVPMKKRGKTRDDSNMRENPYLEFYQCGILTN